MKFIKSLSRAVTFCAVLGLAVPAIADTVTPATSSGGHYSIQTVPLPVSAVAAGTGTNLVSGWTSTTITTNTAILWSSSTAAFTTNTTYVTNTVTRYADFSCMTSRNVAMQFNFAGPTASSFLVGFSVDGANYDLARYRTITMGQLGNTNIVMDGFAYGRILQITNTTGTDMTLTNILVGVKQNAP